ncbi:MAG: sugar ABC transporter permease [Chloroflexi bacterium]|nr:sugar ABC transporter permease [Chloroflexota bacterium]
MSEQVATAARPATRNFSFRRTETLWAYAFLSLWLIGLVAFVLGPMLFSLFLSFFNYTLGREFDMAGNFIGLGNWVRAFTADEYFWPSLGRTAYYTIMAVPLTVIGALLTAMLLNQGLRGTTAYRTIFFMPHLAPTVAAVYIWLWLLNPSYGLINEVIFQVTYKLNGTVGTEGPNWFGDPTWAMPSLVLIALWGAIGGNMMVIFLAGLQGIPPELYEVAAIDGANSWQRFWAVTIPMISPTLFFNSILALIGAFQTFEVAFIGTQGGPAYATWLYGLHIYRQTFEYFEMGYGSTLAWIMFVILSVFTYVQFRASRGWVYYSGEGRDG